MTPSPRPPPPPPPWPALTILCTVDWVAPIPPDPTWEFHQAGSIPWIPATNHYFGPIYSLTDDMSVWFALNLITGLCVATLWPHPGPYPMLVVNSTEHHVDVGSLINLTISSWIDLPSGHTLTARFQT